MVGFQNSNLLLQKHAGRKEIDWFFSTGLKNPKKQLTCCFIIFANDFGQVIDRSFF
jgi:hypothetical protein